MFIGGEAEVATQETLPPLPKHGQHVEAADHKKPAKENCSPHPAASLGGSDNMAANRTTRHVRCGIFTGLPLPSQSGCTR